MAFRSPVAFLCHRQHSALLFRILTPVHAVGRVFATASFDPQSKPSGPIRYVQKPLPHNEPDGSRRVIPLETRKAKGWAPDEPSSRKDESNRGSNVYEKKGSSQQSRARGNNTARDAGLGNLFPAMEGKSPLKQKRSSKDKLEDGGQDTMNARLDVGEYLFDSTYMLNTHSLDAEVVQPERNVTVPDQDPIATAKNYAIRLIARGPQTEFKLRTKLTGKNVSPAVIDETIKDLQRCGLQSDEEYAEMFARSRWTDNTWGPKRIKFELMKRGVSKEIVEAALVKLFQTSDTTGGQDDLGKWGMTTEAADHLLAQARRRWHQGDVKIDVKRRRMIGWLQRRGFPWTIIPDVLKIFESGEAT